MSDNAATESPFDNPSLMKGYPLDDDERKTLDEAVRELDETNHARNGRPDGEPRGITERPAATGA